MVLKVNNLRKSFRSSGFFGAEREVLKGLNFSLPEASMTGFLGLNGSGKTTTLKCVLSFILPDKGDIFFFDKQSPGPEVLKRTGFLPEQPCFYDFLTGWELLQFYARLSPLLKKGDFKDRISFLLKKLDLYGAKDQRLKTYSRGMLQKMGLAQALLHRPGLLILDEPLNGLDPKARFDVKEMLQTLVKNEGLCVFFSSHQLYDVEEICHRVVLLKEGKIFFEGKLTSLLKAGVGGKRKITYLKQGKKHSTLSETLKECQNKLDHIRKEGFEVIQIQSEEQSLQKVFQQITKSGSL